MMRRKAGDGSGSSGGWEGSSHAIFTKEEMGGDVQKVITIATISLLVDQNRGIRRAEEDDIYWFSKAGREGVIHLLQRGEDAKTFTSSKERSKKMNAP
jgi:hypothetical protein